MMKIQPWPAEQMEMMVAVGKEIINKFFNVTPTTEIYTVSYTLSLHDALPISAPRWSRPGTVRSPRSTPISTGSGRRSEEHTSELQSQLTNSYAVFCLKKK